MLITQPHVTYRQVPQFVLHAQEENLEMVVISVFLPPLIVLLRREMLSRPEQRDVF